MRTLHACLAWVLSGAGCLGPEMGEAPAVRASELRPGGDATVALGPKPTFVAPIGNLPREAKADYYAGKALATQPWVRAPTTTDARDGLGPLYNARSCLACHVQGGRGETVRDDGTLGRATLARLSVPGRDPHTGAPLAEPTYGGQLQPQSTSLAHQLRGHEGATALRGLRGEATLAVRWIEVPWRYPDGAEVALRRPEVVLTGLAYGPLHADVEVGLRHAPGLAGVGLLELVPQSAIAALEDTDDVDGDGISGRQNQVWDPERKTTRPGRFGLKANQPSVRVQVAAAFAGDMGITSPVFPAQPCTAAQPECLRSPHGTDEDGFEISEALLQLVVDFDMHLGVVERRSADDPRVLEGREQFYASGCTGCHTPHFTTRSDPAYPSLSNQEIWPYTDLLLHDMGPDLADGRAEYLATGLEWRTPPLWGVGLMRALTSTPGFLHDGRARTIEEAILWHGGEAQRSRDAFAALDADSRRALVSFVRSL